MSPRAAWRLEAAGFTQVFDYEAGKTDWGAAGLPREGRVATELTAGSAADRNVPTCALTDALEEVRQRVRELGWEQCIVVNSEGVVLGRLGRGALNANDDRTVEEAMSPGPSTVRPNLALDELQAQLEDRGLRTALVTTSDGRLVGVVRALSD